MAEAKHKEHKEKKEKKKEHKKRSTVFWPVLIICCVAASGVVIYNYGREMTEKVRSFLTVQPGTWNATLFFSDERTDLLIREFRPLTTSPDPAEKAQALINALIYGPTARGMRTVPKQTRIIWSKMDDDGLLRLNFGSEIIQYHPGGSTAELLTVYSIVNTLTANIPEVKKVQLLFNGSAIETLAGHIDCSGPIYPRQELVH